MKSSINSIESFSTVDGPGIRSTIFFNKCLLRCKYCHNPEMWNMQGENYTPEDVLKKIKRYKPYYKNNGGVTFSGGEPLLHGDFIIELSKLLKQEGIHIALDTAGIGNSNYESILENIDLIIFDIKDITEDRYRSLTGGNINSSIEFIKVANKMNKKFWIRQVIVPGLHDNETFINELSNYIKNNFIKDNIEKIEFLPYHKLGSEKYDQLNIPYPYENMKEMDVEKCNELYEYFISIYEK